MSELSPKAIRPDFSPSAFVFKQLYYGGGTRIVAWTPELPQLKRLVFAVVEAFPSWVEVLFKTETEGESGRDGWQRYVGDVERVTLVELLSACDELVFHDGGSQLCVRRPDTGEHLVLDEHGTVFIYSDNPSYLNLCTTLGFEHRINELIDDAGHWQVRPEHHEVQEKWFIERLRLKSVS
jgi:hypothetical protein